VHYPKSALVEISDIGSLPGLDDIVGLEDAKRQLHAQILRRLSPTPTLYRGEHVLLVGPPGTGKTTLARATARNVLEQGQRTGVRVRYFEVNAQDLYYCLVGSTEENLREFFKRVRELAPAILFLDELDGLLVTRRSHTHEITRLFLSQFLKNLDGGIVPLDGVTFIGTTNRPEIIDDAALRPGRFGRQIYVPHPSEQLLRSLLRKQLARFPQGLEGISDDQLSTLIKPHCLEHGIAEGDAWTGADVVGLCTMIEDMTLLQSASGMNSGPLTHDFLLQGYAQYCASRTVSRNIANVKAGYGMSCELPTK
jgi:SpoVK/Ycf46/Vps4 family AAA+-type ATPase